MNEVEVIPAVEESWLVARTDNASKVSCDSAPRLGTEDLCSISWMVGLQNDGRASWNTKKLGRSRWERGEPD